MCDRCLYVASMEMACWAFIAHYTVSRGSEKRDERVPTYVRSTDREVDLSVVTPIKSSVSRGVEEKIFDTLRLSVGVCACTRHESVCRSTEFTPRVCRSVGQHVESFEIAVDRCDCLRFIIEIPHQQVVC